MLDFKDWLKDRWEQIGYEECPEHLLKALKTGNPVDLPVGVIGEWNTYRRGNDPAEREQRQQLQEIKDALDAMEGNNVIDV